MSARLSISRRLKRLTALTASPHDTEAEREGLRKARIIERFECERDVIYWFNTWVWTYNPKNVGTDNAPNLPMDLFPKQVEAVRWFEERSRAKEDGIFEKSRDIGFTWMAGGYALHRWLFVPGYKANFGSRKAEYVDRIGDPDSIFEKIRMIYRQLPGWMMPEGFDPRAHDKSMLLENPVTGSVIRGESGDDMGRGGRATDYFFDEFAFVEHADAVDAASVANAECRIFGSTVNGQGNLFFRKRHDGSMRPAQIFRFHWSDDPRKANGVVVQDGVETTWAKATRSKMESHKWASEYDIDYSASVEGIAIPAKWVEAAKKIEARLLAVGKSLPVSMSGVAGGDIGAGKAKSVLIPRFGVRVRLPQSWLDPDTIDTANRMILACVDAKVKQDGFEGHVRSLRFDATGVGHGVGSALKRNPAPVASYAVLVGNPPSDARWPDGKTSKEKFANIKAESWWVMREAFKCTFEYLQWLDKEMDAQGNPLGMEHPLENLISIPQDSAGSEAMALSGQLSLVKWGTQVGGKIIMESKEALAKRGISSPDFADALALTYSPPSPAELLIKAYA